MNQEALVFFDQIIGSRKKKSIFLFVPVETS